MFTAYQAKYSACRLLMAGEGDVAIVTSLATSRVEMKPHQVDAAVYALHSPLARGAILADEVGLGKTIEASLVIAQRWAERRRRIVLIVPASLRKQWAQELRDKFNLPSLILEARSYANAVRAARRPFEPIDHVVLVSYEYAAQKAEELKSIAWDLVVFDEAHRLRNVFRKSGSTRARQLRMALAARFKLLLTATPFQNSLLELYGLVSMIDEDFLGDETSFKLLYGGRPDPDALARLRKRLEPVFKRHLRKDVHAAGHVAFTERRVLTLDFEPAEQEVRLYEAVSAYLKRPSTAAFGNPPNPLLLTVARKIVGSSTAAIAGFLQKILERLQARQALDVRALADIDDMDDLEAAFTEMGADPLAKLHLERSRIRAGDEARPASHAPRGKAGKKASSAALDPVALAAEIDEVEGYLALARSIVSDAKGDRLVARLPELLDEVERFGGQRKIVIFTESVRTQRYLADILAQGGHAGRIVLLNGSNADPESARLYQVWASRHAGTEAVSGSKSADMKAAIVEAFRGEDATILIATESGAEGINLQFCSLLVNFDLPWNPQRIEQRIGRCHRYGQRLDVTVINFLNRRNRAEARVYDLLGAKFRLFDGVFGASDEVLGTIASGVDFERAVLAIVQSCRSDAEIEAAFAELERELDSRIAADLADTRRKLFDHMDQEIVARLVARGETIGRVLGEVERHLMIVARAELPDARFHDLHSQNAIIGGAGPSGFAFDHAGATWTSDWSTADKRGWRFFRLGDGGIAAELAERARSRGLPVGHVVFKPGELKVLGLPDYADVSQLKGRAGWLRVSCLTLNTPAESDRPRQVFVTAAMADDGEALPPETVEHMLCVPAENRGKPKRGVPAAQLDELDRTHEALRIAEAEAQNIRWLDDENERLDALAEDQMRVATERAKALQAEADAAARALRSDTGLSLEAKLEEQRRIRELLKESDKIAFTTMERQNKLRNASLDNLDRLAASLAITPELDPLFTIRWEVAG